MDYTNLLKDLGGAEKNMDEAKAALIKAEKDLKEKLVSACHALRPICLAAIKEFNLFKGWQIPEDRFELAFNLQIEKIFLAVNLVNSKGQEPDEEFCGSEVDSLNERLRVLMDKHLAAKKIRLTFGGLHVPSYYYAK